MVTRYAWSLPGLWSDFPRGNPTQHCNRFYTSGSAYANALEAANPEIEQDCVSGRVRCGILVRKRPLSEVRQLTLG